MAMQLHEVPIPFEARRARGQIRCDACGMMLLNGQSMRWCTFCLESKLANPAGHARELQRRIAELEAHYERAVLDLAAHLDPQGWGRTAPRILDILRGAKGAFVSTERLVDLVYQDDPPLTAAASIRALIFRMRRRSYKSVEANLLPSESIESWHGKGYRLVSLREEETH